MGLPLWFFALLMAIGAFILGVRVGIAIGYRGERRRQRLAEQERARGTPELGRRKRDAA